MYGLVYSRRAPSDIIFISITVTHRHVCGLLSHNATAFGAPFCECCDVTCEECDDDDTEEAMPAPSLYDYTKDKRKHYGRFSFEDLCYRAHMAPPAPKVYPNLATICVQICIPRRRS